MSPRVKHERKCLTLYDKLISEVVVKGTLRRYAPLTRNRPAAITRQYPAARQPPTNETDHRGR